MRVGISKKTKVRYKNLGLGLHEKIRQISGFIGIKFIQKGWSASAYNDSYINNTQ